jgi:tRNA(adenine34) deaminase
VAEPLFEKAMRLALEHAALAADKGEVPVGAVLLDPDGNAVDADHNRPRQLSDATAHAELLLLSRVARDHSPGRLEGHTLVVTLEPCVMCAGAAVLARLHRIVYGAPDLKAGACWSLYNIPQDRRLNHHVELVAGVLEAECSALLTGFFAERRAEPGASGSR